MVAVLFGIGLVSGISYIEIARSAEENANIRIDRAARAAAAILCYGTDTAIEPVIGKDKRPLALRYSPAQSAPPVIRANPKFDELVLAIGNTNQGAANIFSFSEETGEFDRIATTFRKPDGSMPPAFAIRPGHPAYENLASGQPFSGNVPVQGRLRLAYLMPILNASGGILGAAAVDVGWADDLTLAEQRLQSRVFTAAVLILAVIVLAGGLLLQNQLTPLRRLASAAHRLASGVPQGSVPYAERPDEIGDLAHGLARVTDLQEKLQKLAYVDPVTTAGNRTRYFADLKAALESATADNKMSALFHLDFIGFSKINDAFGQHVGNRVLMQTYARLSCLLGHTARISRISADDFCILVPVQGGGPIAEKYAARIIEALSVPFRLDEGEIQVDPRLGIALVPQDAGDVETAHRVAGLALRAAKESSNKRHMFFSAPLNERIQSEMLLETRLRAALATRQMHLFYQPQVCPSDGTLIGLEALIRWPNGSQNSVPPSEFIPLAEKTGLIIDLGHYVLEEACRQAAEWLAKGFDYGQISVNVSPIEFRQSTFASNVKDVLEKYQLPPEKLCLEVTENVFVDTSEQMVLDILFELQSIGVLLSLDDFGAGYSSLSYLHQLPFQELKIDRTFLTDADKYPQKKQLYEAIVGLGKSLGLRVVAEGAETEGEYSLTVKLGCDGLQGYFCSRPLPAAEIMDRCLAISRTIASDHVQSIRKRA
ncbi:EAL domain-containing protein [Labrenzia sp. PHM005]|uniref:EAL domain-containing protein n=1 Tax=Labrenzia sp. PHM005 TaxID=2590016 RepID=UPI001AD8CCA2|nr:EAL domain-containing protein [Labrenzia sp. PHM005]